MEARGHQDQSVGGRDARALTVTLANLVYFEKPALPQALANRLIRLAAFQTREVLQDWHSGRGRESSPEGTESMTAVPPRGAIASSKLLESD